jgi:photosystem II stability/assembly factor-like uncharacterized protein
MTKQIIMTFLFFVNALANAQVTKKYEVEYFQTAPNTQIRTIESVSDSTIWFGAYRGIWGYTEDAGSTWHIDSIKNEKSELNFRSMAVLNDSTVLLMSIASPAYIYKTNNKGKTWKVVYENSHKDAFLDCIKFYDGKNGFALGDPINGCATILYTNDAGETWSNVDCKKIPILNNGEAFFAASNSNMKIMPPNIFIATGGKQTQVWHSKNMGKTYISKSVPLPAGEQMTGIFSLDFYSDQLGVIAGGNYDRKDSIYTCLAITKNAGNTWEVLGFNKAMFGSCVKFIDENSIVITGHSGTAIYNLKTKKYEYLLDQQNQELYFHALNITPNKKHIWLGGRKGMIGRIVVRI